ncbi:MAG: ADP-ribosylglycohydrolase family protein [Rickettsiales bacterium]
MNKKKLTSQMQNALWGIAVGDALGLGVEVKKTDEILALFPKRVDHYIDSQWSKAGDVSDDTGMSACIIAAICRAKALATPDIDLSSGAFSDILLSSIYQAFLYWAEEQKRDGKYLCKVIDEFRDKNIKWPKEFDVFRETGGAGISTLRTLSRNRQMGTFDNPPQTGEAYPYSDGCGGLMRVIPLAVWCAHTGLDSLDMGMKSAVITHGDPQAYITAGLIAETVAIKVNDEHISFADAAKQALQKLQTRSDINSENKNLYKDAIDAAIKYASQPLRMTGHDMDMLAQHFIESHGLRKSLFTANIVFLQSIATLFCSEKHQLGMKEALQIAVTHSGDSDSVGAIVGGALGCLKTSEKLLAPEIAALSPNYRKGIEDLNSSFSQAMAVNISKTRRVR